MLMSLPFPSWLRGDEGMFPRRAERGEDGEGAKISRRREEVGVLRVKVLAGVAGWQGENCIEWDL
jgi:hypothetical protein